MKRYSVLLAVLLAAIAPFAAATTRRGTLTNEHGLSNSSVTAIYQDSSQRMWFGTWDGLNLYDGARFRTYKFAPDNPNTISNNVIRQIVEESDGVIWVATDHGVNRIDTNDDRIRRFYPGGESNAPIEERLFSVAASPDGEIFCSAAGWGVARYDRRQERLVPLHIPKLDASQVRGICAPARQTLLLHTAQGALVRLRYASQVQGEVEVTDSEQLLPAAGGGSLSALFVCPRTVWLATDDGRLHLYDRRTGTIAAGPAGPAAAPLRAVAEQADGGTILAFASAGAFRFDPASRQLKPLPALDDVAILSLYCGSEDILWAGSDGQGIVRLYEDGIEFERIDNREMLGDKRSPVRSFFEDSHGTLYVATKGNGIYTLHADGTPGSVYNAENGLSNTSVYALAEGYGNDLFIGHDGMGIDVLDLSTGRIATLGADSGQRFGSVYAICRDAASGMLWLGTSGYGLVGLRLDMHAGGYSIREQRTYVNDKNDETSLGNNTVFAIVPAGDGRLWVGTRGGGLNLFDPRSGRFSRYTTSADDRPISSNDILSLLVGRDSTLWIGTSYGVNRLERDARRRIGFRSWTEKEGLPNNTVHGMLEDASGVVWMSTNKGLASLDPATGKVVRYDRVDQLQNNEFSDGAYFRGRNGKFHFGGVDGFNRFDPADIRLRSYTPSVVVTQFAVKQKPLPEFRPREEVVLGYNDNFFSIQFSALEYIRNENCEYAYRLEGFNDDWVQTSDRTAVFTNVPPGSYRFRVRSTNGDKVWSDRTTTLSVRILPPWWSTWWARLLYVLVAAGLGWVAWMILRDRMAARRRWLIEQMERQQQSDSYEAKLRFFTSIAHEFCTPLTLIYGSGEQLLDQYSFPPEVARHLRIVKNSAARMQRLIGELMEFRRVDTGHYTPRYSLVDVPALLSTIVDNFEELNGQRRIDLGVDLPAEGSPIVSDRDALEKIFYNLISNAYKYTPKNGWIRLSFRIGKEGASFRIANSGKGIKRENLANVFNRFEILDNFERAASEGRVMRNGIGLSLAQSLARMLGGDISVESVPGESAAFTLTLPELSRDLLTGPEPLPEPVSEHAVPQPEVEIERPAAAQSAGTDSPAILVVDDEQQIRELLADLLGGEYEVLAAADGQEAIDILKHRRPDLIISDLNMPNLDGLGLLRYLKQNEITKYIPFVFLAFRTDVEQEISGYNLGSEAFIPKPFHPKQLLAVVRQILDNRRSLRTYFNSAISTSDIYEGNTIDVDDKKFIVQLTRTIEENLTDENLSLDFLCDKMCVSRMGLYRKIREITQMTPSEYIRQVKLRHATHLLRTTGMTIQEIMFCSGFNNKSYFYREFAKAYHMSPKEMREREA